MAQKIKWNADFRPICHYFLEEMRAGIRSKALMLLWCLVFASILRCFERSLENWWHTIQYTFRCNDTIWQKFMWYTNQGKAWWNINLHGKLEEKNMFSINSDWVVFNFVVASFNTDAMWHWGTAISYFRLINVVEMIYLLLWFSNRFWYSAHRRLMIYNINEKRPTL